MQVNPQPFITNLPHELAENSVVIFYKNFLWTFNLAGKIEKELEIKDAKNDNWEDIAQDSKYIYIADFGNNSGTRRNQKIFKNLKKKRILAKRQNKR